MTCAVFLYISALSRVQDLLPIVLPPGSLDLVHPSSELKFIPPLVSLFKPGINRSRPSLRSTSLPSSTPRPRLHQRAHRFAHDLDTSPRRDLRCPRPHLWHSHLPRPTLKYVSSFVLAVCRDAGSCARSIEVVEGAGEAPSLLRECCVRNRADKIVSREKTPLTHRPRRLRRL